jgi:hypothetical protein
MRCSGEAAHVCGQRMLLALGASLVWVGLGIYLHRSCFLGYRFTMDGSEGRHFLDRAFMIIALADIPDVNTKSP